MRIASLFQAALCLMLFAPLAAQQPGGGSPGGGAAPVLDSSAFEDMGLTPDQRSKIQAIHERIQKENEPLREQARKIMGGKTLRELTPAQRDSLRPKLRPIGEQMMANVQKGRDEILAILTPEQQKKFREHMREMREHMREGREHDST